MNEKQFGISIMKEFNGLGLDCTRIESHGTGVGIPDLFVQGFGWDCWIELKCDMKQSIDQVMFKVPWRPGQQAWMMRYFTAHNKNKCCITIMKVKGGMMLIANARVFNNQEVYTYPRCMGDTAPSCVVTITDKLHSKKTFNLLKTIYLLCNQAIYNSQTKLSIFPEQDTWEAGKGDWEDE